MKKQSSLRFHSLYDSGHDRVAMDSTRSPEIDEGTHLIRALSHDLRANMLVLEDSFVQLKTLCEAQAD